MEGKIISLDNKWRLAVPTANRDFFRDGKVFWSLRVNSILLANTSFD